MSEFTGEIRVARRASGEVLAVVRLGTSCASDIDVL